MLTRPWFEPIYWLSCFVKRSLGDFWLIFCLDRYIVIFINLNSDLRHVKSNWFAKDRLRWCDLRKEYRASLTAGHQGGFCRWTAGKLKFDARHIYGLKSEGHGMWKGQFGLDFNGWDLGFLGDANDQRSNVAFCDRRGAEVTEKKKAAETLDLTWSKASPAKHWEMKWVIHQ